MPLQIITPSTAYDTMLLTMYGWRHQNTLPIKIGWHTRGMIDEVRVFSRALTATEIGALASE